MASKKPKLKKDTELLTRLHRNTGLALDATVKRIVDAKEDIPAAIASAAVAYLKLHGAAEEIEEDAREEAQEAAAFDYVPRIPLHDTTGDDWSSVSAFCASRGLTTDDVENISKMARAAAAGLPEGDEQREKYLQIAREAEAKL